ncbi:MAG: hypothetical protein PHI50_03500 [Alphaproteobacteria bacterium]|nr:hypothetical protein [Alphaproteobacteria bacterium]
MRKIKTHPISHTPKNLKLKLLGVFLGFILLGCGLVFFFAQKTLPLSQKNFPSFYIQGGGKNTLNDTYLFDTLTFKPLKKVKFSSLEYTLLKETQTLKINHFSFDLEAFLQEKYAQKTDSFSYTPYKDIMKKPLESLYVLGIKKLTGEILLSFPKGDKGAFSVEIKDPLLGSFFFKGVLTSPFSLDKRFLEKDILTEVFPKIELSHIEIKFKNTAGLFQKYQAYALAYSKNTHTSFWEKEKADFLSSMEINGLSKGELAKLEEQIDKLHFKNEVKLSSKDAPPLKGEDFSYLSWVALWHRLKIKMDVF